MPNGLQTNAIFDIFIVHEGRTLLATQINAIIATKTGKNSFHHYVENRVSKYARVCVQCSLLVAITCVANYCAGEQTEIMVC